MDEDYYQATKDHMLKVLDALKEVVQNADFIKEDNTNIVKGIPEFTDCGRTVQRCYTGETSISLRFIVVKQSEMQYPGKPQSWRPT